MKRGEAKGITLIALVITIIVLLILAGVTIATLSGNNSAPQKATEAAQKDAIAGAKDEIAMETQEALLNYYNDKYVSKTSTGAAGAVGTDAQSIVAQAAGRAVTNAKSRNKELKDSSVSGNTITLKTKSFTVTGTIEENGGITWSDSNPGETPGGTGGLSGSTQSQLNGYVGKEVVYTAPTTSGYSGTWRLLYADASKNEAYVITTSTIPQSGIPITGYAGEGADATAQRKSADSKVRTALGTYGTQWNAKWWGLVKTTKLSDSRHKATAYLCDTANWSKYVGSNVPSGTYAVGGPTKELLAAAWEAAGYNAKWSNTVTTVTDDVEITGYKYDKPTGLREKDSNNEWTIKNSILPYTKNGTDGLFNNGTHYWLASPSSLNAVNVCYVNGSGCVDGTDYDITNIGVRPLVVVPLSGIQESSSQTGKLEIIIQQ